MNGRPRLGELLAAVGNHEAKGLVYLAMEPDEDYGHKELQLLWSGLHGPGIPVRRRSSTAPQKYVVHSFEPAGLATTWLNEDGRLRHARSVDAVATALVGHLLETTEGHSVSLLTIFGKTGVRKGATPGGERSPGRRLALMRAILEEQDDLYLAALARRSGLGEMVVSRALEIWSDAGLVTFRTHRTYEMKSTYRLRAPIRISPQHRNTIAAVVADHLNDRLASSATADLVISRDEIERGVSGHDRWQSGARAHLQFLTVMSRLCEQGRIETVSSFKGQTRHSAVELSAEQLALFGGIVSGADAIAAEDTAAIERGLHAARAIINDPARTRPLLEKAFAATKQATNPLTRQEKHTRLLAHLAAHPDGLTSQEILAALTPDLTKQLVVSGLTELAKEGLVAGVKAADGPYYRWYPVDHH